MAAIKDFFKKKKLDAKFKMAGTGHKLSEEDRRSRAVANSHGQQTAGNYHNQRGTGSSNSSGSGSSGPPSHIALTEGQQKAALAAEQRLQQHTTATKWKPTNTSLMLRGGGRTDLTAAADQLADTRSHGLHEHYSPSQSSIQSHSLSTTSSSQLSSHHQDQSPDSAASGSFFSVSGIFFKCPLLGPDVLPKAEMEERIREFLYEQLEEEGALTATLIIQTFNKNRDKIKSCIETLCKYLDNMINSPEEEKFHRIRLGNRVFQDRVSHVEGAVEFLEGVGFKKETLEFQGKDEAFYVIEAQLAADLGRLVELREALITAEPIKPVLDRNIKVFTTTSQHLNKFDLPDDFFSMTSDDVKKEQVLREAAVEQGMMLRTKAMREQDERREQRRYKYTLLRVRMPDGLIVQGTFRSNEKLAAVYDFIRACLVNDWCPFQLSSSAGLKLMDEDQLLVDCSLVPAAVVIFAWDPDLMAEISAQKPDEKLNCESSEVLKPEFLANIESL